MKWLRSFCVVLAASLLFVLPLAGCGGAGQGKLADVQAGAMPERGDWTGVWFSELYGYLHMVQEGSRVDGKWIRPQKDRWGELHGEADGDLLKFSWTEYVTDALGPNTKHQGKGYFKYSRPQGANVDDIFAGQIGRGEDEVGDPWDAVKQRDIKPDLASIGGSGTREVGGGDWDGEKNKETEEAPEEPAEPPAPDL
jgi:hypothetical protein